MTINLSRKLQALNLGVNELEIKVLSSGSRDGNCTWVKTSDDLNILLDVGISFKKMQKRLSGILPDFAFVTHEHNDHANLATISTLLSRGTKVIMTGGTQAALGLEEHHNLIKVDPTTGGNIQVFDTIHDAAEPAAFCLNVDGERIYYITDTQKITFPIIDATRLIVEANHSAVRLALSKIEDWRKERIKNTHLSIENLISTLKTTDLAKCREIHLIHVSSENGDAAEFAADLKPIVGDIVSFQNCKH